MSSSTIIPPIEEQFCKEGVDIYQTQYLSHAVVKKFIHPALIRAWNANNNPNLKMADLACGEGFYARLFNEVTGGGRAVGIDLSPSMISLAKAIEAKEKKGLQYAVGDCTQDLTQLPEVASLAPFDIVNSVWLLDHASDRAMLKAMATSIAKLLRPEGATYAILINDKLKNSNYVKLEKYGIFYCSDPKDREEAYDGKTFPVKDIEDPSVRPSSSVCIVWTRPTLEQVFQEAGFGRVEFLSFPDIYKPVNQYEEEFFKDYLDQPDYMLLKAVKN